MTNQMIDNLKKFGFTPITPNGFAEVVDWMSAQIRDQPGFVCPAHFEETRNENGNTYCVCCGEQKENRS